MAETVCRSPLLLSTDSSALLIVDAQEKLLGLIPGHERLVWNLQRLAQGAGILSVPRLAAEQYPEKLGATASPLQPYLAVDAAQDAIPSKLSFSCAGCRPLVESLRKTGCRQVVIGGLETHVCVLQTALDLTSAGFDVFLIVDAVGARFAVDHDTALRRMDSAGLTLATTESVLFEWCERAGTPEFKQISQLVRQPPPDSDTES